MTKKALVLMLMLSLSAMLLAAGKTIELEVFRDWRGNDCQYKSSRPFFTINDIYELERFWEKANADESMPWLDFEKYMLLVWNPGPSMFDHHPVRVDKFLYRDGRFFVIMDLEKKLSGGYWRRPFVATLLPKIKKGDIFIMRKDQVAYNRVKYRHVFTLWDMSRDRSMPFEVAKLDTPEKKPEFIDPAKHPRDLGQTPTQTVLAKAPARTSTQLPTQISTQAQTQSRPASSRAVSMPKVATRAAARPKVEDTGFDDLFGSPLSSGSEAAKADKKEEKKSDDDDFFPDFGAPAKQPSAAAGKPKAQSKAPGFDEDPLFGEEFDINF